LPEHAALPRTFLGVRLELTKVVDLNEGRLRQRLGVSLGRLLNEDWRRINDAGTEAATQAIGRAAYEAGFQGIVVPSAAKRSGANIVVFPDRLGVEGLLELVKVDELP